MSALVLAALTSRGMTTGRQTSIQVRWLVKYSATFLWSSHSAGSHQDQSDNLHIISRLRMKNVLSFRTANGMMMDNNHCAIYQRRMAAINEWWRTYQTCTLHSQLPTIHPSHSTIHPKAESLYSSSAIQKSVSNGSKYQKPETHLGGSSLTRTNKHSCPCCTIWVSGRYD